VAKICQKTFFTQKLLLRQKNVLTLKSFFTPKRFLRQIFFRQLKKKTFFSWKTNWRKKVFLA